MSLPSKCPLCSAGTDKQSVITQHVYGSNQSRKNAFFRCSKCDVVYQYPGLSKEEEKKFYADEFEKFMSNRSMMEVGWHKAEKHFKDNETTYRRRRQYLKPYLKEKMKILEIGCSSGFMLLPLVELGHECFGVEPSGVFSEFVKTKNIPVYNSIDELESIDNSNKFDLIMHFFVLEHISNPIHFLRKQLSFLKPGGNIIFEIPNVADPLYTIYNIPEFEKFYWSIAHPWYFSEKSIEFVLSKLSQNYKVLLDQRYDLSNHLIWARDGKPGGMNRFSSIFGDELDKMYKKTLIKNHTCDTLIVVITKDI